MTMRTPVNTAPEIARACCVDCGEPLVLHTMVTLPSGGLSMRRIAGRKRTRCERCQAKHKGTRWYVTPSGRRRHVKGDVLV